MASDDDRLDPAIVASLYLEHAAALRRFVVGVLKDRDLAADVLQVAFAKAVESGHRADRGSLKAWLFRVAYNEAIAVLRKQDVREKGLRRLSWQARTDFTPHGSLCQAETIERVRRAIELLPKPQQDVVRMRIHEDKTFATIAAELGLPLGTVLSRMQLALRKLRQTLGTED